MTNQPSQLSQSDTEPHHVSRPPHLFQNRTPTIPMSASTSRSSKPISHRPTAYFQNPCYAIRTEIHPHQPHGFGLRAWRMGIYTSHLVIPITTPTARQRPSRQTAKSFTQRTNVLLPPNPETTSNPTSTNPTHFPHPTKCPQKTVLTLQCLFPYATKHAFLKKLSQRHICRRGRGPGFGSGSWSPRLAPPAPRCGAVRRPDQEYKNPLQVHAFVSTQHFRLCAEKIRETGRKCPVRRRRVRKIPKNKRQHKYAPARQVDTPKQLRYISCSVFGDHTSNRCGKITCVMTADVIVGTIVGAFKRRKMLILQHVKRSEPT
jgi:hypothetical protein